MIRPLAAIALAAALMTSTVAVVQAAAAIPPGLAAALNDSNRPDADKMRDAVRHPGEVLAFAGVRPGMTVAELGSGGGYYTRLLAAAVGPNGKVYAVVTQAQADRPNGLAGLQAIAMAYPNVQIVTVPALNAITLPTQADLFWTTENYHDFHNGPTADIPGLDKAVFANLKPRGIFYVEDHAAAAGAGAAATAALHRMDEAIAKSELTAAGFRLMAESDVLHNTTDDHSVHSGKLEAGHFTTDRFMLKMQKPA